MPAAARNAVRDMTAARLASTATSSVIIGPNVLPLVLSRIHRWTMGHSVAFFDNDFAGRLAQKQMQTARAVTDFVAARDARAVSVRAATTARKSASASVTASDALRSFNQPTALSPAYRENGGEPPKIIRIASAASS